MLAVDLLKKIVQVINTIWQMKQRLNYSTVIITNGMRKQKNFSAGIGNVVALSNPIAWPVMLIFQALNNLLMIGVIYVIINLLQMDGLNTRILRF